MNVEIYKQTGVSTSGRVLFIRNGIHLTCRWLDARFWLVPGTISLFRLGHVVRIKHEGVDYYVKSRV